MRKALSGAAAVVFLLSAASIAWSAAEGNGPRQDRVAGGGIFGPGCTDGASTFCVSFARSFSIDAASNPEGGGAYGTFMSGREGATTAVIGRVTCLQVEGGSAVVGGYVTGGGVLGGGPDVFFYFLRDTATPGVGHDGASANFFNFSTSPDLPKGFPRECPTVDSDAFGFGHFTLTGGDVQIVDEN